MKVRCELPDCSELTENSLCQNHRKEAQDENNVIVVCEKCMTILAIEPRKENDRLKYRFADHCESCKLHGT